MLKLTSSQLTEKITEMEDKLQTLSEREIQLLEDTKIEHDDLVNEHVKGVMFRSKVKWNMEAERNTKYFYSLERSKHNAKVCSQIIDNGEVIDSPAQIMEKQRLFYQELYTSDPDVEFTVNCNVQQVPEDDIACSESEYSAQEYFKAAKGLKNGSCPGSDGLPAEYYKVFWKYITPFLIPAIEESIQQQLLFPTARQGILNLIPKKDKDTRLLKNLRPITLLNTDYKIVEKLVANRMTTALQEIIHEDQKGFLPNRRIAANIRKILDITVAAQEEEVDAVIISCDYMKCFDRIETDAVIKAMQLFGFSRKLQQTVSMLYTQFYVRIQNNGDFTEKVHVQRSVRQGGPASNALFLTIAEILAIMIRNDEKIKGVYLKEVLHLLNQFADDMDVSSMNEPESISRILELIDEFHYHTGFLLNYDKTTVYRVGSAAKSNAKCYTAQELKWTNEQINVLGVEVQQNQHKVVEANYKSTLEIVDQKLTAWSKRKLSLLGKISVINTLIASLFVYKMTVIPRITDSIVSKLNAMLEKFIWDGRKSKIKLQILQTTAQNGGANLVNFARKDDALKCSWIRMILNGEYSGQFVYNSLQETVRENIWICNLKDTDVDRVTKTDNEFWKDVLKAWCRYHFDDEKIDDQMIWCNSLIRIADKPIVWRKPYNMGLRYVSDLLVDGEYIEHAQVMEKYGLSSMQYNSLKTSIPQDIKNNACDAAPFKDVRFAKYMHTPQPARYVYQQLSPIPPEVLTAETKWQIELESTYNFDMIAELNRIKSLTTITKYRSFQYRLLYRAVITNIQLNKWKIVNSESCSFCNGPRESYYHLFYECEKVQNIWDNAKEVCAELNPTTEIDCSYANVICNRISEPSKHINNFICLVVKQYIYAKRCLKDKLTHSIRFTIFNLKGMEKYYAIMQNRMRNYCKKWEPRSQQRTQTLTLDQVHQVELIGKYV